MAQRCPANTFRGADSWRTIDSTMRLSSRVRPLKPPCTATGVRLNTREYLAAVSTSPRRRASRTSSRRYASSSERYGDHPPDSSGSSTSTSATQLPSWMSFVRFLPITFAPPLESGLPLPRIGQVRRDRHRRTRVAGGKSPYGMHRTPIPRSSKQQDAWSLRAVRILLDAVCTSDTFDKLPGKQSVSGELVVSVLRSSNHTLGDQPPNATEGSAHDTRRCRSWL